VHVFYALLLENAHKIGRLAGINADPVLFILGSKFEAKNRQQFDVSTIAN
tara:strand:+ start:171 stop:320 length:150 start_codon:yes stop_codon:yes gene_type:complete